MGLDRDRAKRIVLLTDGNQTAGDVWRVLPRLKQANVRVYPIPAKVREDNDAWIAGIDAPADIHAGEPVTVTVRVFSAIDTIGTCVAQERKNHARCAQLATESRPEPRGLRSEAGATPARSTLSAEVAARGDRVADNNRMQQSVWVKGRSRVLYVEGGQAEGARYLADALAGQGIDTRVIAPAALPGSVSELAVYDALILSDTPAKALTARQDAGHRILCPRPRRRPVVCKR